MRRGRLLQGDKIVPEQIRVNRTPYYAALNAADDAWKQGHFDVNQLAALGELVKAQLTEAWAVNPYSAHGTRPDV
jgi:hypothetical protein